jgi:hypothetical protein
MNLQGLLAAEFELFGEELANDLEDSALRALREGGRTNPQTVKLDFHPVLSYADNKVTLAIKAVNGQRGVKYWDFIEKGRKKGAKGVPLDVVGKKWQNENNIDPRKILAEMAQKSGKPLKKGKKSLNYDKAAKALSFIIQRAIKRKGIKPKPYINRVINDGRLDRFRERLIPIIGEHFQFEISGIK